MAPTTITIQSEGQALATHYKIISVDVIKQVNRIPCAEIALVDGNIAQQTFALSEDDFFDLGKEIEIKLRREGSDEFTVFKGLVSKQNIEASEHGSQLIVSLDDIAIKAAQLRNTCLYEEQTDADIITSLIEKHNLTLASIEATEPEHLQLTQYNCTDWDFMLLRAQSQGLIVNVDDGVMSVVAVDLSQDPHYKFEYGLSGVHGIKRFEMQNDALANYEALKTQHWDMSLQESSGIEANADLALQQGAFSISKNAETFTTQEHYLHAPISLDSQEVQAWLNGKIIRSRLARFKGSISVSGIGEIKPLIMVEIKGLGSRFNGKALVTGVRHRVSVSQGWVSDLQLGLNDSDFAANTAINDHPAAGLLTGVNSLCIGKIAPFEEDPKQEFRLKVQLVAVGEKPISIWARIANMDAGKTHGSFFYPDEGDEVVVGFFNQDPRHGVILGSMYSSASPPIEDWGTLDEDNFKRGFVTKSGSRIEFSDEAEAKILIKTATENQILLDDEAKEISVTDPHGNSIVMSEAGITITSCKDLIVKAEGKVSITGEEVDIK